MKRAGTVSACLHVVAKKYLYVATVAMGLGACSSNEASPSADASTVTTGDAATVTTGDAGMMRDPTDSTGTVVIHRAEAMAKGPGPAWNLATDDISRTNLVRFTGPLARHFHPDARHSLVVIEGQVVAYPGDQTLMLGPGDYISIPAGLPHSYDAPQGATLLVSFDAPAYDQSKTVQVVAGDNTPRTPTVPQASSDLVVVKRAEVTTKGGPVWSLRQDAVSRVNLVSFSGVTPRHYHPDARHSLMVIEGNVTALVGAQEIPLAPGDFITIPPYVHHNYRVDQGTSWVVSMDAPYYDTTKTVQVTQ